MPAPPNNDAVRTARAALAAPDDAEAAGLDRLQQADIARLNAHRMHPGTAEETAAEQEFADAQQSLDQVLRPAVATARTNLQTAITAWFDGVTVDADIARLPAFVPIIFFPVRVETRFDRTTPPGVLKVRIYPDEIFIDSHETRLTRGEVEHGKQYYQDIVSPRGTVNEPELEAWRAIVKKMSPERAAYVVRVMEPTFDDNGNPVTFPSPPLKTDAWTRAGTAVLPDRWVVVVYRGTSVRRYQSNLVTEPLPMTVDPTHTGADQVVVPGSDNLLKIDQDIAWTVDYDRALAQGMAVTVPLASTAEAADLTGGFDKVIVFGVKTSMPPTDTGAHLQSLFEAQHYTRGLGLVKQGSPTNNTEDAPTPLPRDPADPRTFLEERAGGLTSQNVLNPDTNRGGDVAVLAKFFGFQDAVFPNVLPAVLPGPDSVSAHLGGVEQAAAQAMNRALWPVLFGYYIQNFVNANQNGQPTNLIDHDVARAYFASHVRGRGPAPAFRVGLVPYGLLPVVSLATWAQQGTGVEDQLEGKMIAVLRRLQEIWRRASANVSRVKPGLADGLSDLLKALALAPSAREMRIRDVLGPSTQFNLAQFSQIDYPTISNAITQAVGNVLRRAGVANWSNTVLAGLLHNALSSQTAIDFVVPPEQISEVTSLSSDNNYVDAMRPNPSPPRTVIKVADIFDNKPTFGGLEKTMFYKVLRHAVLTEITRIAAALAGPGGFTRIADLELVGIRGDLTVVPTYQQLLKRTDFAVSAGAPLGDFARARLNPNPPDGLPTFVEMNAALGTLAPTETAELDRLFAETVDLASHRLDAWITALAARRVLGFRDSQISDEETPPLGSHLGGYAFLENVRPATTVPGPIETQSFGGGFIQAPSLSHAAATAVLRSGYLAYRSEDAQKYAIDLSSERVRGARQVLETIRAGTTLGEVLGQIFERRLHDDAPDLDRVRYALRLRYPLVAGKALPLNPGDIADRVAARNVVDGLLLWTASRNGQVPWGQPDLPTSARTRVEAEIKVLEETIDRVADLVISESVFQLVRGNVTSAVGQMDALSRGRSPSDPEVAEGARGGPGLTHRAAVVFPGNAPAEGLGWPTEATPRAVVEPVLDRWLTNILGNPGDVACAVTLADSGGATSTKTVTLAMLAFDDGSGPKRLRPLDVVALAREVTVANRGSLLDQWIAAAALRGETDRTVVTIDYTRRPSAPRTFPEVMEVARAAAELLAGARALAPGDLSIPLETPDRRAEVETEAAQAAQLVMDAADAAGTTVFVTIRGQLVAATGATALRNTLEAVASYIPTLFPPPDADADALDSARNAAVAELDRRKTDFDAIVPTTTSAAAIADAATRKLRILFGAAFLPLPSFPLPAPKEVQQSLDARDTLLGADGPSAITRFLQQASQVQEGLGRWRTLSLYLAALGSWRPRLDVVQFPFTDGEVWAALPLAGADPPEGRTSLVLLSDGSAVPSTIVAWRGVVLDGWVERIPSAAEDTGVAFNFDNPLAEAGQAVLIAAPPGANGAWTYANVLATLSETFDLAKIRTVDRELLDLGQLLPTSYLGQDHQNNTVSTLWPGLVRVLTTGS